MEVECSVTPPSTLGESSKDSTVSENLIAETTSIQFLREETNSFEQSNGVNVEEISEASQVSLNESIKTMLTEEIENSNFVKNVENTAIHSEANTEEANTEKANTEEANTEKANNEEAHKSIVVEEDIVAQIMDNEHFKIEIQNVEATVTSDTELLADDITDIESKTHKFDNKLKNILESNEQSNELTVIPGDEQNTSDFLTQLEGHTEFGENVQEHNDISSGDNNNFNMSEVLNKKELLDILEGNEQNGEDEKSTNENNENIEKIMINDRDMITQVALQQINDTIAKKKCRSKSEKTKGKTSKNAQTKVVTQSSKSSSKKKSNIRESSTKSDKEITSKEDDNSVENVDEAHSKVNRSKELIKVLVEDWDDDDFHDHSQKPQSPHDTPSAAVQPSSVTGSTPADANQGTTEIQDNDHEKTSSENISESTSQQRRVSRVIKKKIIFDPDNPDTFTSKKIPHASKTKSPQTSEEQKEIPPPKKTKVDIAHNKTKEKSPMVKTKIITQWKKPQPKNHKRLSEVDKLLMDEGAVNMLYQLNSSGESDTPKIKKNIRSKAAFIKKLNQKTPETNEIKFRERKPIKIEGAISVKRECRSRTSGAASSPAPSEQYESHTADDSIIIRRHSSSSYSSSCLSPRRLSDIEMSAVSTVPSSQPAMKSENNSSYDKFNEVFMSDNGETKPASILDRKDCLTLKEKLNWKLSRVMNMKRKRENKTEAKHKKVKDKKSEEPLVEPVFNNLTVNFEERVAQINILKDKTGNVTVYNINTIGELTKALDYIDSRSDVSVTLLLSESGDLCSGLDLSSLQQHKNGSTPRLEAAIALADAIRSLFVCMERHSKFVCAGVEGACVGLGLSLLALCDIVLASDRASFTLLGSQPVPGVSVLTSHRKSLCRSLVTEMLVFGRQLSASEALSRGLVSRTLWPDRFNAELHAMVKDIAAQPPHMLQLKKRLLCLRNNIEPKSTFLSCLDAERELLTSYWASDESGTENN